MHPQATYYTLQTGHVTIAPTAQIPKRFVLTTLFINHNHSPYDMFAFTVDVLLVPVYFNMQTCPHLYLDQPTSSLMRGLLDNIILLQRIVGHGKGVAMTVDQWGVPEDVRNKTDYKLVVTCPTLYYQVPESPSSRVDLELLLEMEF
jgi:hypothetical protein